MGARIECPGIVVMIVLCSACATTAREASSHSELLRSGSPSRNLGFSERIFVMTSKLGTWEISAPLFITYSVIRARTSLLESYQSGFPESWNP